MQSAGCWSKTIAAQTFARLGSVCGLSESGANKIYHQILDLLLKVVPVKSRKHLLDGH